MTIDDLINIFKSIFNLLWSSKILGMPYLFWFVVAGLFGIVFSFIKGKKE